MLIFPRYSNNWKTNARMVTFRKSIYVAPAILHNNFLPRNPKKRLPKSQFVHDCLANTFSTVLQQSSKHQRHLIRGLMCSTPIGIPKPRYVTFYIKSVATIKRRKKKIEKENQNYKKSIAREKEKGCGMTNMSLMANVRPCNGSVAGGVGGWGKGSKSKRSKKAPKSCLWMMIAFLLLLLVVSARSRIPATVIPATIQTLGLEALAFIRLMVFDIIGFQEKLSNPEVKGGFDFVHINLT